MEPSEAEIQSLFSDLAEPGKPAISSLVPAFSHNCVPLCARNMLSRPLTDFFKEKYMDFSYPDLLDKSEELFHTLKFTTCTRVTASKMKLAARTNLHTHLSH